MSREARFDALAAELAVPVTEGCGSPRALPSRDALRGILETLRLAIFPVELGPGGLTSDARRAWVVGGLERALAGLEEELGRDPGLRDPPAVVVEACAAKLPELRRILGTDLHAAVDGDPAARGPTEVLLCYPGFAALLYHRVAHALHGLGATLVARTIADLAHSSTAIDIHPGATIGERFFIDHGTGVVIGETAILGRGVRLYQGVTLGARNFPVDHEGHLIRGAPRHPILEDDVTVFSGANILGRITIGQGSVIGGGVWLTRSVGPHSRVLQAPLRADTFADGGGI